jgi:hypothetical protein
LVQVCTNGLGTCTSGTDLTVCGASLEYQCGTSNLIKQMLLDECGGHASPYHFHTGLAVPVAWRGVTAVVAAALVMCVGLGSSMFVCGLQT